MNVLRSKLALSGIFLAAVLAVCVTVWFPSQSALHEEVVVRFLSFFVTELILLHSTVQTLSPFHLRFVSEETSLSLFQS